MNAAKIVAHNLRRLRVSRGISQEALALEARVDRTYVSRLERGRENPSIGVLERLMAALDAPLVEVLAPVPSRRAQLPVLPAGRKHRSASKSARR